MQITVGISKFYAQLEEKEHAGFELPWSRLFADTNTLTFCTLFFYIKSRIFKSFEDLVVDYDSGELHPADLKPALSKALNKILEVSLFTIFSWIEFRIYMQLGAAQTKLLVHRFFVILGLLN